MSQHLISDNILMAHKVLENIRKRKKRGKKLVGVKLDLNKAYDRVNWQFLHNIILAMGFPARWCHLIMQCVTSVSFSICLNRCRSDRFKPQCGLR